MSSLKPYLCSWLGCKIARRNRPCCKYNCTDVFSCFHTPLSSDCLRFVGTVLPLDFRLIQVSLAHFTKKQKTFFVWRLRNCFTAAVSPSNFERGVLLIHSPCPYSSSSSWSLPILSSPKTVLFIWTTLPFRALSIDATDQLCQGLSFSVCALLPWWWSSRPKDLCVCIEGECFGGSIWCSGSWLPCSSGLRMFAGGGVESPHREGLPKNVQKNNETVPSLFCVFSQMHCG